MTNSLSVAEPKIALVTGCSSGIGFGLVAPLLQAGFVVFASLRGKDSRGLLFQEQLQQHPNRLILVELDVNSDSDRQAVIDQIENQFGRLDVLVNNAGLGVFGALENVAESELRKQIETNVTSLALLTQAALPLLRKSRGKLINLSSVLGRISLPLTSLYCLSKFAVEGLSEALYHELKPYGVQVCLIEPGGHRTQFNQNLTWGTRIVKDSQAYSEETQRYRGDMRALIEQRGVPPENVVKAIMKVINTKRSPLRVTVGVDSTGACLLKRIIPESLFLLLVQLGTRFVYYKRNTPR